MWYTDRIMGDAERKDVTIRLWDSTKAMIDFLCQEDKRTIAAELDVVLAQVIEARGIDPLTLKERPIETAPDAPEPAETAVRS